MTTSRSFFGHPGGLATLFFTEMWERFSYYGIRALLVLYMTAALADGGFGFSRADASAIQGIYGATVYLASLPGGWVADRWLGLQRSVFWGGILIALGHVAIGLSAAFAQPAFFLGLVLIVVGTGLLKPNVSALVGGLYPEGGARQDAGFSIFYMGINTGAFIAPLVTGWLGERVGWHMGFGAAGVGMLIGVLLFRYRAGPTLGTNGALPTSTPAEQRTVRTWALTGFGILLGVVVLSMAGVITPNPVAIAERLTTVMLSMSALYFLYLFFLAGLTPAEQRRLVVVFVLFLFSMVFWGAFEQAPTSLNLFARDFTDRVIGGREIPTSWFQSINALFVIVFAPVVGAVWVWMGARGKNPSSPTKFAVALVSAGVGFLLMVTVAQQVVASGGTIKASPWWLVASYFLQSVGELCLSPVGLSSMIALAPKKFVGQMMGIWFTSIALGNLFAGLIGGKVDPSQLNAMPDVFSRTAWSLFIAAAILLMLVVPIRKMMQGQESR